MQNPSPLRYPGGKNRLYKFILYILEQQKKEKCTYVEPFAGGAGIALSLLLNNNVDNIIINDYDKAIYSFWRSIVYDSEEIIEKIVKTPITVEEWYKQKEIYKTSKSYSVELGFATLFLNRTNRSGILNAGPIGGYNQSGEWTLDVRFEKNKIIEKIKNISQHRKRIRIYNKDIISLLVNFSHNFGNNLFFYFDPPYYNKGQKLYKNYLSTKDHKKIRDVIVHSINTPWIMTYDNVLDIIELYKNYEIRKYDLIYSAANKGIASELIIFSDQINCPTNYQLLSQGIDLNLRI